MEKSETLLANLLEMEQALANVEHNGVQYVNTLEGSFPCGGCKTYQVAVRKALQLVRALIAENDHDNNQ
jgi:hypothetical protein